METYPATLGDFEIVRPLAEGGCGQVYLAHMAGAAGFSRTVAIKRIRPEYTSSQSFIDDFIREARIGGYLQHHNVVQVFGFEQIKGHYFLIMEYVDGVGLERVVKMTRKRLETLPFSVVAEIVAQAADGLQYVHTLRDRTGANLQLVHRDLKPSNLMISRMGLVKITDFGVARAAINVGVQTQAGLIKGTLAYLSPEQARDEPLDGRSDLYTLGSILYELLTLRRLFPGDSVFATLEALGNNQVQESLERLPKEAATFLPLLQGLLTRDPGDRIDSADIVARQAREIQRSVSTSGITLASFAEQWIRADEATKVARELADSISDHGSLPRTEDWASVQDSESMPGQASPLTDVGAPPTRNLSYHQSVELQATEALSTDWSSTSNEVSRSSSPGRPRTADTPATNAETAIRGSGRSGDVRSPSDSATLKLDARAEERQAGKGPENLLDTSKGASRGLYVVIAVLVVVLGGVAVGLFRRGTSEEGAEDIGHAGPVAAIGEGQRFGSEGGSNDGQEKSPGAIPSVMHLEAGAGAPSVPEVTDGREGQETGNVVPGENGQTGEIGALAGQQSTTQSGTPDTTGPKTGPVAKAQSTGEGQPDSHGGTQQAVGTTTDPSAGNGAKTRSGLTGNVHNINRESQEKGELTLTSMPSAHAFLDGDSVGETPIKKLALPAGTYEIRLSRPDLGFQQHVQVTVKPGKGVRVICLETGCDVVYP